MAYFKSCYVTLHIKGSSMSNACSRHPTHYLNRSELEAGFWPSRLVCDSVRNKAFSNTTLLALMSQFVLVDQRRIVFRLSQTWVLLNCCYGLRLFWTAVFRRTSLPRGKFQWALNFCWCSCFAAIAALCTWAYSRYSGNLRDAGVMVDEAVTWAWQNFLSSLTQEGVHRAVAIGHRLAQVRRCVTFFSFCCEMDGVAANR